MFGASDRAGTTPQVAANGHTVGSRPAPTSAEYDIQFTLAAVEGGTSTGPCGVVFRWVDSSNYYGFRMYPNAHASQNATQLYKVVAGTLTSLHSVDNTITAADVFKVECRNATKKVYQNGVEILTTSDNALTAAGEVGLRSGFVNANDAGNARNGWLVDDYSVNEVSGSVTGTAALAGAATVAAVGTVAHTGVAALNGTATVAAVGTVAHTGIAALAGAATVAAVGTVTSGGPVTGVAALAGAATLAAVGKLAAAGVAALSATATLAAAGTVAGAPATMAFVQAGGRAGGVAQPGGLAAATAYPASRRA